MHGAEAEHERHHGRGRGEQDRVERGAHEIGIEAAPHRLDGEIDRRQQEAEQHRQRADRAGRGRGPSAQHDRRRRLRAANAQMKALVALAVAFEREQRRDRDQHHAGDLRGAGQARAVEPGGEDRERQRAHAEIFAGADVVERFHQGEREADRERRPRQRQRDVARQHETRRAERARDLEQARALRLEHRARGEEHIRVEHEREDEDRAGQRADVRIPGGRARPPAGEREQQVLHRAERIEDVDIDIGDDIGREGERQRERPGEHVAAGKPIGGDEPGGADADQRGQRRDAGRAAGP